jgi:hypothetical protein
MQIVSPSPEEPIFTGSGRIDIRSRTEMDFHMHATPRDGGEAFRRLVFAEENPHNIHAQLGVLATQYDSTEWNAGWVPIRLGETLGSTWRLSGSIDSLMASVSGRDVAPTKSIEVIYDSKLRVPLPLNMTTSIRQGGSEVLRRAERGNKTIDTAETQIDFFVDPELDATWAVAATSEDFPHPYAENWVSEPLCLLLGQLVFPRLVARNFGDRSTIWLRPSPAIETNTLAASILQEDPLVADDRFWEVYRRILTMIVRARNGDGERNFETHPLVQYYHEVIQATRGSAWVWCMTLASAIEGVVTNLLTTEEERKPDYPSQEIENLRVHIETWNGSTDLQRRILGLFEGLKSKGTRQILRRFKDAGVITSNQFDAWYAVRNQVMHGNLVSPWSSQKLVERMRLLAELMHRLSMKYVEQHSP